MSKFPIYTSVFVYTCVNFLIRIGEYGGSLSLLALSLLGIFFVLRCV